MTYIERIINLETNEIIERPYTAEELAKVELAKEEALLKAQAEAAKAHEKSALLAKLGITEDEAKLLLS